MGARDDQRDAGSELKAQLEAKDEELKMLRLHNGMHVENITRLKNEIIEKDELIESATDYLVELKHFKINYLVSKADIADLEELIFKLKAVIK